MDESNKEVAGMFGTLSAASVVYGIILIFIAMLIFMNTKESYVFVTKLLAVYLLVKGIIDFVAVFNSRNPHRGRTLFVSVISFIAGLIVLAEPLYSAVFITGFAIYVLGFAFIFSGFMLFKESVIMAILSIIIGFLMFFFTKETAAIMAWFVALMILLSGVFAIVFGASAKNVAREMNE